jgi:hypothetical protein
MGPSVLYTDHLVEITRDSLLLRWYYFPCGNKRVPFSLVEWIRIGTRTPLSGGARRIWGTGGFSTWFPLDVDRPRRNVIFQLKIARTSRYIGFTVEDAERVKAIFTDMGLVRDVPKPRLVGLRFIVGLLLAGGLPLVLVWLIAAHVVPPPVVVVIGITAALLGGLTTVAMLVTLAAFYRARAGRTG